MDEEEKQMKNVRFKDDGDSLSIDKIRETASDSNTSLGIFDMK